jgi:carboxyl-terminal processing protease
MALCVAVCVLVSSFALAAVTPAGGAPQPLLPYFEEVYKVMQENYYFDVKRSDFERFLNVFKTTIYPSILLENKSSDYVRWRSAAYLVDMLKQPDDVFSRYWPPKPAEKFVQEVYGKKIDLGIEGHLIDKGYVIDFIEPRSDAYDKGVRENDLVVRLDGKDVLSLGALGIADKLMPLEGTGVQIDFFSAEGFRPRSVIAVSREYFKQGVFVRSTGVPDIYCLELQKFNQGTPEDFARLLGTLRPRAPRGIIIDLRGNPGGPPLAARAISSFFLPNGEELVYFEGRTRPRSGLDIPVIPAEFHVDWPIAVLVDKGTGSAAELFSGVLQDRHRAVVIGEDTAGQVLLKSLYDLSDGSKLALVNARGHFPDGRPFPFSGVHPDEFFPQEQKGDMVTLAAKYLFLKNQGGL